MLGVKSGRSELGTLGGAWLERPPKAAWVNLRNCSWLMLPAAETVKLGPTKKLRWNSLIWSAVTL